MEDKKISTFSSGLIWFGAAVAITEIMTGTLIAPLGFKKGLTAILLGHLIGCILLYFAGLIGAKTKKSAMETVKISFGQKGSIVFSILNVVQLVGWTAVMIVSGAMAASMVISSVGTTIWSLIIGALIILWVLIGIKNLSKVNIVTMIALFVMTLLLSRLIFNGEIDGQAIEGSMSFGSAVELCIAMPLSWLPLISDYTRNAAKPKRATFVSAFVYFLSSSWMYLIGLAATLFTGESDVVLIMMKAGLGILGLIIIVISTVTTTFLDVYSAGISFTSIHPKSNEKMTMIIVCLVGTALAIFTPITEYENFLYFISSVFAPMIAIQMTDFFILKRDYSQTAYQFTNLIIWFIGFIIYRLCMTLETPIGSTVPVMIVISILSIILNKVMGEKKQCLNQCSKISKQ